MMIEDVVRRVVRDEIVRALGLLAEQLSAERKDEKNALFGVRYGAAPAGVSPERVREAMKEVLPPGQYSARILEMRALDNGKTCVQYELSDGRVITHTIPKPKPPKAPVSIVRIDRAEARRLHIKPGLYEGPRNAQGRVTIKRGGKLVARRIDK